MQRRNFLTMLLGMAAVIMVSPMRALAQTWNNRAFEAVKLDEAAKNLAMDVVIPSKDIDIVAPDRAENGAIVQVEIHSRIANTESITLFVENNPTALIGQFNFSNGALPQLVTRIKMAETADVKVVVKAGSQYFSAAKNVVVLENGCG